MFTTFCSHTHTHERLSAKVKKKTFHLTIFGGCYGTPRNSCIQKGKQIVRITTINKSLHIYSVGKFSAFVHSFCCCFFCGGGKYRWILGYICTNSKCANEQIRNSHDEKKSDGGRERKSIACMWH